MKRIFILILLFIASPSFSQELARMNMGIVGGGVGAPAGCDGGTNEVGDRTQEATANSVSNDYAWVFRAQSDCTGTITNAYLYHNNTTAANAKICIYTSDNAVLTDDGARVLVGCSGIIAADTSTGWKTNTITGAVTSGSYYWVVIVKEAVGASYAGVTATTNTLWYRTASGYYASPPDPLPNTGWSTIVWAPVSAYVDIQ